MPLDAATKARLIAEYGGSATNTGSPAVQVALLTERIKQVTEHLKKHKKDYHSRRGLLLMVARRARLLKYISQQDIDAYRQLTDKLGIRQKG
ncbi:MAG: 30S ribosomal protein S15 [Planctomycetota bacterium]|nr:30S ribosomal protein S15 [Planctomycetota bacterium]MCX8039151.1 30S ribosomal protein S15 [Planctomycetota bacterium]MDW8372557.1 30S ribosomal protein S15 [Planctomycetota bacterium]